MQQRTELLGTTQRELEYAGRLLRDGRLVVFPTETVYGLGADAANPRAVSSIFAAKGRPADNPLIVHLSSLAELAGVAGQVSDLEAWLLTYFAPGPFTLVLPRSRAVAGEVSAGLDTVAVRVPLHPVARRLIAAAARPIAAPSANRSGEPSPTEFAAARSAMYGRVAAIIDGGECRYGIESTVARVDDLSRTVQLLRPGSVTPEMLAAALSEFETACAAKAAAGGEARHGAGGRDETCRARYRIVYRSAEDAPTEDSNHGELSVSPGTRHAHYRPKARVYLLPPGGGEAQEAWSAEASTEPSGAPHAPGAPSAPGPQRVGAMLLSPAWGATESSTGDVTLSVRVFSDLDEYGRELYRSFVWFDSIGCDSILAELPPPEGVGLALRDRLFRASDGRFWRSGLA